MLNTMNIFATAVIALVMLLPAPGFGAAQAPRPAKKSTVPQAPKAPPPPADAIIVAEATNRFACDLYAKLKGQPGNLFFSPESISTAIAMTYCGAKGQTAAQIEAVLGFQPDRPIRPEWVAQAYKALLADLGGGGKDRGYELSVANSLWGQKGYGFLPQFLSMLKTDFGAGLQEVDFAKNTEGSRQAINAWVEKETRDKIKDLIGPGMLQPATRMVLVNAIYFKGKWASPFKKAKTEDGDFHAAGGANVRTPMMNQTEHFGYFEDADLQAIEMPYVGDAVSMVILLPKKTDGLAALEASLSAKRLSDCIAGLAPREVQVSVPRFKTTASFLLGGPLSAMGMPLAFDAAKADFSGMNGGKEPLWIGEVIHKAFIDVNEEGTEAAAATAIVMFGGIAEPPPVFRADHPFVYLIRDKRTGCILFMGRMANPKD